MPKNFVVATMKKFNSSNLGGIEIHNERKTDKHSNKDIDPLRSQFNFDFHCIIGDNLTSFTFFFLFIYFKVFKKIWKYINYTF